MSVFDTVKKIKYSPVCMFKLSNTHAKFRKNLLICSGVVKEEASIDNMVIL